MNIAKALVIDDSKVAHLALSKLLKARGIAVEWLGSGEDAIAYLEKQQPPDIVFMDIMMPGMGGFEATKTITRNATIKAPPIIMCSGNSSERDKLSADESGALGFLSKPYTPDELDQILETVRNRCAAPVGSAAGLDWQALSEAAERRARSAAEEVARHVAAEVARFTAEQSARALAQETGRATVREAERVARETAVAVAGEAGRNAAAGQAGETAAAADLARAAVAEAVQAARGVAEETARSVADRVAREISTKIADHARASGVKGSAAGSLDGVREALASGLQAQVSECVQDALARHMADEPFEQRLTRAVQQIALPMVESAARDAAIQAARAPAAQPTQEVPRRAEDQDIAGAAALKRANLALLAGAAAIVVALLVSMLF